MNNQNNPNLNLLMIYMTEEFPFILHCSICNESFRYTTQSKIQQLINHNRQYGHLCKLLEQCKTQEIVKSEFENATQSHRIFSEDEIRFYSRNRNRNRYRNDVAFKELLKSKVAEIEALHSNQQKEIYSKKILRFYRYLFDMHVGTQRRKMIRQPSIALNVNQRMELDAYKRQKQVDIDPITESELFQRYLIDLLNCDEFLLFLFLYLANRLELEVNELRGLTFREFTHCCIPIVATPQGKIERSVIKIVENQENVTRLIGSYLSVFSQNEHKEVVQLSYANLKQILECNKREMCLTLSADDYKYKSFIQNIKIKGIRDKVFTQHQASVIILFFDQKYKKPLEQNRQLKVNSRNLSYIKQEEDLIHQNMVKEEEDADESPNESEEVVYIDTNFDARTRNSNCQYNPYRHTHNDNCQFSPINSTRNNFRQTNPDSNAPNQVDSNNTDTSRPNQESQNNPDTRRFNQRAQINNEALSPFQIWQHELNERRQAQNSPNIYTVFQNWVNSLRHNSENDTKPPVKTCQNNTDTDPPNQTTESQEDPFVQEIKFKQDKKKLLRRKQMAEQSRNKRTKIEP